MKIKPTVNSDSIKFTWKELFMQFELLWESAYWYSIFKLTDVLPCCQTFENSSANKGNALILNPLIWDCVSQKFTVLRCTGRFIAKTFASSEAKVIHTCEQGSHVQVLLSGLCSPSSLKTNLLVFSRLCLIVFSSSLHRLCVWRLSSDSSGVFRSRLIYAMRRLWRGSCWDFFNEWKKNVDTVSVS